MASPTTPSSPEAVSLMLRLTDAAVGWPHSIHSWEQALRKTGREHELLLMDDGSRDSLATEAQAWAKTLAHVRYIRQESPRGFGACLRTATAVARFPLFAYVGLDYPYTPADLPMMLERIQHVDPLMQRPLDLISGCRTGRPLPRFWVAVGRLYRGFCRVALGLSIEPLPGWLGFREHFGAWIAWLVFAVPLHDPFSEFKLVRKSVLERFPIQSDGDFAHVELVAKATFLTCMIDELPLTPKPAAIPRASWAGCGTLFRHAIFHPPEDQHPDGTTEPNAIADPPDVGILSTGEDGARQAHSETTPS